jgi:hypothetical protein
MSKKSRAQGGVITPRKNGSGRARLKEWTTRDGRKVRVCHMTDTHLVNTILYIRKVCSARFWRFISCIKGLGVKGEIAREMVEDGVDEMLRCGIEYPDIYFDMLAEADDRGLSSLVEE